MLLCMRCCNALATLHETEIAFSLRITDAELAETKVLFIQKGFINDGWDILNWNKRQYVSDSSTGRSRKHRAKKKEALQRECNVAATPPEQSRAEQNRTESPLKLDKSNSKGDSPIPKDFKNLEFSGEFVQVAAQASILGDTALKCWQKFKQYHGHKPAGDVMKHWKAWVMKEFIKPADAPGETPLTAEQVLIQKLGAANWHRQRKMHMDAQDLRMLEKWEKEHGTVWWIGLKDYYERKAA